MANTGYEALVSKNNPLPHKAIILNPFVCKKFLYQHVQDIYIIF